MIIMLGQGSFSRTVALLGVVAALGFAAVGCGGGGASSSTVAQKVTKSQFVKLATSICKKSGEEKESRMLAAIKSEEGKGLLAASKGELENLASRVVLPLYGETISRLGGLNAPLKDKARLAKIVQQYEAALEEAEGDPSAALEANPFAKADEAAAAYGFACSL